MTVVAKHLGVRRLDAALESAMSETWNRGEEEAKGGVEPPHSKVLRTYGQAKLLLGDVRL